MVARTGPVVAAVAALMLSLVACGGPEDPPPAGGPTTPAGVPPGSGALGEPPAPAPVTSATVAVYYVGDEQVVTEGGGASQRPRLYREFREIDVGDGSAAARVSAALTHMLADGSALDPDFRSGWPDGASVNGVEVTGSTATVDLAGAGSHSAGSEAAHLAVQELIWTATAEPGVDSVTLLLDGSGVDELWGHVGLATSMTRAPAADALALLWLISPQHGQSVPATFEVHLYGAPFEATAQLRVREEGTVVHEQFVTLGGSGFPDHFGEAKLDLTLDPGTYTLEVFELSAVDGSEIRLDDKVVTVS